MYGGSFSEEQLYSAKAYLLAVKDAHECLREAARLRGEEEAYKYAATTLLAAKTRGAVEFKDGHVVRSKLWEQGSWGKVNASLKGAWEKGLSAFEKAGSYAEARDALDGAGRK